MSYQIPRLPDDLGDVENKAILKKLAKAHQALAELKGVATTMPNQQILISTLSLQEAKDSSEIENIITTQDDLYSSNAAQEQFSTLAAKEVHKYAEALYQGYLRVSSTSLMTNNDILAIQAGIENNRAGFRTQAGTELKNGRTGEVVYTPPQHPDDIIRLMSNLEQFINTEELCDWDPLTRMAVIHHQFESIHPFYDGNGRTGRVINILYLVQQKLLDTPILYLSRFINQNKSEYYRLLQEVRDSGTWQAWILFILEAVEVTSRETSRLIRETKALMLSHKNLIRENLPAIYSQDLINHLFCHPYTKINFVAEELSVHRNTASKYLEALTEIGLLEKYKKGKENYFINSALFKLLFAVGEHDSGEVL